MEEEQEGEAEAEEEAVEGEDAELPAEAGEGAEAAEANDGAEDPAENGETEVKIAYRAMSSALAHSRESLGVASVGSLRGLQRLLWLILGGLNSYCHRGPYPRLQRLLSEVEKKLVNRAKRFNVEAPTSVEVKLKARALRFGTSSLEDVAKEMKGPGAKGKATGDVSEEELARIKARAEKFGKTTSTVLASAEKRKQQEELAAAMQDRAKRFKEQGAAPSAALEQRARRFKKSQLAS